MDGSAYSHLPLGGIFVLALIGAAFLAVAGLGGTAWSVWWLFHHVTVH